MNMDPHLQRLFAQVAADEPEELRTYLVSIEEGKIMAQGSTATLPHPGLAEMRGFLVPQDAAPEPHDYFGVYLTLEEYMPLADPETQGLDPDELIDFFARSVSQADLLRALVVLNRTSRSTRLISDLIQVLRSILSPKNVVLLDNALQGGRDGKKRVFLSRQVILKGLEIALTMPDHDPRNDLPPHIAALLFVHAIATSLRTESEGQLPEVAGYTEPLFMEVVQNATFYQADEAYSVLDRYLRLWQRFGLEIEKYRPRIPVPSMLEEAIGLSLDDFMAMGFLCYANASAWQPGDGLLVPADLNSDLPSDMIDSFVGLVSATPDEIAVELASDARSPWNFVVFQDRPLLRLPEGLLVIDETLMLDLVTKGLYWDVHDHEKSIGEKERHQWTQTYGEMIELSAEDQLKSISPIILGGGTAFYSEEDVERAYGGKKRCDAVIDFGTRFCLLEIVSGQLSTGSRSRGDFTSFESDTEKLVLKKARQLDAVTKSLIADEALLTKSSPPTRQRMIPIIVVGWGYPSSPVTARFIEEKLAAESLLADSRVAPLCIVDISEIEMLEGLSSQGESLPDILADWKTSSLADMSLRNYLLERVWEVLQALSPTTDGRGR